ncbi:MAG: aminotransferase class V-fold PLP-dependent enzyme [Legionellaceae bacterium]|nr:aminotransferase class V-fold PLP-dependent enzyme [Legionellaceae bacterium]
MQNFISDNNAPAHPEVLSFLGQLSSEHQYAYAQDDITRNAKALFKQHFGNDIEVFFTQTGSASNLLSLGAVTDSHQAIICADTAHVHMDECGAIERLLGIKLLALPATQGKITPMQILSLLKEYDTVHRVQPKVVSLTQCTEWGTVYTLEEIRAISHVCHQYSMQLHMDGARLANAAVALGCSLREMTMDCGVDVLSFGGTKNGLMSAEAVVFSAKAFTAKTPYIHKQLLQLSSKMRYISAQFIPLLLDDLWYKNAKNANDMATMLANKISGHVEIVMPVETNAVFAKLPENLIEPLQNSHEFSIWNNEENIVRLMTAFNTKEETVLSFARNLLGLVDI